MDFNLKRLGLNTQSKILSITHGNCMDGTSCQICLDNVFKNLSCIGLKYNEIDSVLENIIQRDYDGYDFVFLTDISPVNSELLRNKNKIILLDHHNSAKYHHNPNENKYVFDNYCGAAITKAFLEKFFGKKISSLNNLIYLVNDYDLWTKQNAKSTFLNELHFKYFPDKFRKRFFSGDTRLTKEEIQFIRKRKSEFSFAVNNLELYELNKISACYFETNGFLNELCESLLKTKYDVVFCKSQSKNSISVRNKLSYVDIGSILKELGYGGGHPEAGAFFEPDFTTMKEKINNVVDRISEEIERHSK